MLRPGGRTRKPLLSCLSDQHTCALAGEQLGLKHSLQQGESSTEMSLDCLSPEIKWEERIQERGNKD